jgi:DNA primase
MADNAVLDEILKKTDLIALISETTPLEKKGKNHMGLCPFHDEKTPSFSVSEDKQLYHCFSCKASGNAITFLKEKKGMSASDAIQYLADAAGIPLKNTVANPLSPLYTVTGAAKDYFHVMLMHSEKGQAAKAYLESRKLTPQTIKTFEIGLSTDSFKGLAEALLKQGYLASEIDDAGVVKSADPPQDFFVDRLMIPLKDAAGHIVGFSGRTLDNKEPKYLNSAENQLFKKRTFLYGLDLALPEIKKQKSILITEGYFDVMAAHQAGLKNIVALMGTMLSDEHIQIIKGLTLDVILVLDGDTPGLKATDALLDRLRSHRFNPKVVQLPRGDDIASYLDQHTADDLKGLVRNAEDALQFYYRYDQIDLDLKKIGDFERFKRRFFKRLAGAPKTTVSFYLSKIATLMGIGIDYLWQDFTPKKDPPSFVKTPAALVTDKFKRAEIAFLHYFLKDEHYTRWFRREFEDVTYIDPKVRDIQFEIFEHYDLHPQSCLVYPLFKQSLNIDQQQFLDANIHFEAYPFRAEEFDDLIRVMHQHANRVRQNELKKEMLAATSMEAKIKLRQAIDALKKET